jgi:type IV pilus assembly protein PilC
MSDRIDIRDLSKRRSAQSRAPSSSLGGEQGAPDAAQPAGGIWGLLNKDIRLFGSALPDKIKESFYLELGTLLAAGMDIRASLELIRNEQPKKKYREFFDVLLKRVVAGMTLSSAMKAADLFTPYEFFSVRIGEETGKLVIVLNELAVYYKKKIDQKRQIVGALTYPVLVMVVAISAVSFMMAYVVPMFADVLKRFGGDLPMITRMVLRFSRWITASGPLLVLLPTGIAALLIWQRKRPWFRKYSSALVLRIPVIGDIIRKIYLSRFSNTMALLIGSRIPMLQAIQLLKQMVSFYPIESSLTDVEEQVMSGTPLHSSLGRHPIYPRKMISLVKVGEEVNQLDTFFSKISTQYSSEVEYRTNLLSKFLEPLIIVVLGLVVGIILIAMYLPLFKLGQAV